MRSSRDLLFGGGEFGLRSLAEKIGAREANRRRNASTTPICTTLRPAWLRISKFFRQNGWASEGVNKLFWTHSPIKHHVYMFFNPLCINILFIFGMVS